MLEIQIDSNFKSLLYLCLPITLALMVKVDQQHLPFGFFNFFSLVHVLVALKRIISKPVIRVDMNLIKWMLHNSSMNMKKKSALEWPY